MTMNDFECTSYTTVDRDPVHKEVHWSEPYNPQKRYETEEYMHDYGHGMLTYKNSRVVTPKRDVVIASKVLTDAEFEKVKEDFFTALFST